MHENSIAHWKRFMVHVPLNNLNFLNKWMGLTGNTWLTVWTERSMQNGISPLLSLILFERCELSSFDEYSRVFTTKPKSLGNFGWKANLTVIIRKMRSEIKLNLLWTLFCGSPFIPIGRNQREILYYLYISSIFPLPVSFQWKTITGN